MALQNPSQDAEIRQIWGRRRGWVTHRINSGWSRMALETNVEIFQRVIEAFNRDGADGVLPYYTDDAEVYDPDLPPGTYRGRRAVSRVIEMLTSGFDDVEIRGFRLLPAGDRVVALIHTHRKGERNDLEVETRDAHMITFRDGKITYWRVYLDQAEALADAGLDPELARPASPGTV